MSANAGSYDSKTHDFIPKASDLKLAIKTTRIDGVEYVDIRDYVPSTEVYGKGVLFERHLLTDVIDALVRLNERLGGTKERTIENHPGQGTLL